MLCFSLYKIKIKNRQKPIEINFRVSPSFKEVIEECINLFKDLP